MQSAKQIISNTITYGFSNVLGRILNYLLTPLHTYILYPEDFGIITEFYSYIAIAQTIYGFGIETSYYRFSESIPNFKNFALSYNIVASSFLSIIIFLFSHSLANLIKLPHCENYIHLCTIILLIDSWLVVPFADMRLRGKAKLFSTIKFLQIIINITFNILIIVVTKKSILTTPVDRVYYIFLANVISNGIFVPICIFLMKNFKFFLSWEVTKKVIKYSLPIVFISLTTIVTDTFSRLAIKYWLPTHFYEGHNVEYILGIFSACQKISIIMSIGIQSFRYAIEPMIFSQSKGSRLWYDQTMYWFIVAGCIIMLICCLNLEIIANIFLRKKIYKSALGIVPYLLFTNFLSGIYYNLSAWFKICDKAKYGIFISSIGCFITVILNYFLIPKIGYWGSIYASLFSYTAMIISSYAFGQRFYPIPYSIKLYSFYLFITISIIYSIKVLPYTDINFMYVGNALLSIFIAGTFFYVSLIIRKKILLKEKSFNRNPS